MHYYNWFRKHTTTNKVPKFVMNNFNDSSVRERVAITTEKSRKNKIEKLYKVWDNILIIN